MRLLIHAGLKVIHVSEMAHSDKASHYLVNGGLVDNNMVFYDAQQPRG